MYLHMNGTETHCEGRYYKTWFSTFTEKYTVPGM